MYKSHLTVWSSLALSSAVCSSLPASLIHQENFDYANGTVLVQSDTANADGPNGWKHVNQNTAGDGGWITVQNSAISYGGAEDRQDIYWGTSDPDIPGQNGNSPGSIYYGFDLALSAAGANSNSIAFFGVGTRVTDTMRVSISARAVDGGYVLGYGFNANDATFVYDDTVWSFDETYRVVLRHEIVTGAANNKGWVWVFPDDLTGVDTSVEANNAAFEIVSDYTTGATDWEWATGSLLQQHPDAGTVSHFDSLRVATDFTNAVVVPEPSTYAALLGLLGLGLAIHRRKKN